jgi:hypothetical protein
MVFNGNFVFFLIWIVLIVWVIVLTFFLLRMIGHYNQLTKGISTHGLKEILEEILRTQNGLVNEKERLKKELHRLAQDGALHIQKIGLERFNPFSDTGGSQSFTLAILDEHDNGLVMTSLYARTGNRWYVKEVRLGKGKDYDLSKEELNAIHKAQEFKGKHI